MKKLLSFSSVLILTVALFTGCQQDLNSGINSLPTAAKVKPNAIPAWTFEGPGTTVKGKIYPSIAVSNSDGTNLTEVATSVSTSNRMLFPTWSPSGSSISFVDMPNLTSNGWTSGSVWGNYALRAVNISVTGGVASGNNLRTIYSVTTSDQKKILSQTWNPAASGAGAGKIAFLEITSTESNIYLVEATGGTPTLLYSVNNTDNRIVGNSLTWNGAGTQLAFSQYSGSSVANTNIAFAIKIIDLNGTIQTSLLDGTKQIGELQWSNGGPEQITFEGSDVNPPAVTDLYVGLVNTAAGSTATKLFGAGGNGVYSYGVYWSPDNTELTYRQSDFTSYKYNISTGVSTSVGVVQIGDWK